MNPNAIIVPPSYKRKSAIVAYGGKENVGSSRSNVRHLREPFLDIPTNIRLASRRAKSTSQAVEAIYRYTKQVNGAKTQTMVYCKHKVTNYRNLTPQPSYDDDNEEEVFLNSTDHYITFMAGLQATKNEKTGTSPIFPNVNTKHDTLISLKDPESCVKMPAVKRTLAHKMNKTKRISTGIYDL